MRWMLAAALALLVAGCSGEMPSLPSLSSAGDVQLAAAATSFAPLTPLPSARLEDDRLIARDGAQLPLRRWLPEARPIAVVLALHGFNDYSNSFATVGPVLARGGIATFAFDQRGFGLAPGTGLWAGEARMVGDVTTAVTLLRRRYPGLPIYLLGESMGGAVAILAASNKDGSANVDGVILAAPAVWGRQTMNLVERVGLWLADLAPSLRWSPRALPVRIIASDNFPMLRALGADPLVIKSTRADTVNGLVDMMGDALAAARHLEVRALILYGQRDQIIPRGPMAQFVAALPPDAQARQRVAIYPHGYHMLMRDLEGPQVIADIGTWITDAAAPLPSGADRDGRDRLLARGDSTQEDAQAVALTAAGH